MKIDPELRTTEELDTIAGAETYPEEHLIVQEYAIVLDIAMRKLLSKEQMVIRERYFNGRSISYRQLAKKMACSHEAARKQELNALGKLKELLTCHCNLFAEFTESRIPPRIPPRQVKRLRRKKEDISHLSSIQKKARKAQQQKEWLMKNSNHVRKQRKALYDENREWAHHITNKWVSKNKDRHREYVRLYHKEGRAALADWYVRSVLTAESTALTARDIPPEQIIIKRKTIELERLIKLHTKQKGENYENAS